MSKNKNAATATAATANQASHTKVVNLSEKSKLSYIKLLDQIMLMGCDEITTSFVDDIKSDVRISDAHTTLPLDCFPGRVQRIIRQFAGEQQTCCNYVATNVLVAVGTAVGTNVTIVDDGYENVPVLFACLVGPPSAGKTPSMRPVLKPLESIDTDSYNQFRSEYAAWKKEKNIEVPEPHCEQIIVKDATPEAIIQVHSFNRKGVLIHADEAHRFFRNIDKYCGGDFISSLRESWAGDPIKSNRKTECLPVLINRPFISLLCGTQTEKLKDIFGAYMGDGFCQRFLFAFPNKAEDRIPVDVSVHTEWANIICSLRKSTPISISFDEGANNVLAQFNHLVREQAKCCEDEGLNSFSEWLLKQNYIIRRLAGILHLLEKDNTSALISASTVKKSIRLSISFGYHFARFLDNIQEKKQKISIGDALKMVIAKYKIFEDLPKRKGYTLNGFAKVLGISQPTLWQHLQ